MKERDRNKKVFRVPEDYFESLENKMSARLKEDSRGGFKVPEGYFEDFEVNLTDASQASIETGSEGVYKLRKPEI